MENQLRSIEEAIRAMEQHVLSPGRASAPRLPAGRRVRGPHDGGLLDVHRRVAGVDTTAAEHCPPASPPSTGRTNTAKLPRYSGATPLEPYLAQIRLAVRFSQWGDEEAAVHLALALEGPAAQVLLDLPPGNQGTFTGLTAALERRFGQRQSTDESREQLMNCYRREGERLGALAADVRLHTQRGYPRFSPADQEDLALHMFLRALSPESLRQHVRLAAPRSMDEALQEAERAEAIFDSGATSQRGLSAHPRVRVTGHELGEGGANEVCRVSPTTPTPPGRTPRDGNCCHRCGEVGHFARDCLAPAPKPRSWARSGNGGGAAQ